MTSYVYNTTVSSYWMQVSNTDRISFNLAHRVCRVSFSFWVCSSCLFKIALGSVLVRSKTGKTTIGSQNYQESEIVPEFWCTLLTQHISAFSFAISLSFCWSNFINPFLQFILFNWSTVSELSLSELGAFNSPFFDVTDPDNNLEGILLKYFILDALTTYIFIRC